MTARARATFSQRDVTRAVKAVRAAGVEPTEVQITPDGTLRMFVARADAPPSGAAPNPWDTVLE
jgi:hypothetical protein